MQTNEAIVQNLRERGYRLTPQRLAILQLLEESSGHLAPTEIYEQAVRRMPGLTEATVYRTLDFLARHGLALVAHVGEGRLVYESARHNHHHLICRDCGEIVEIEHDLLEALAAKFRERTGFTIDVCHVTFFGHCPGCAETEEK
jgi:Fur family transcriptional regulator, ferric uptake regulator